MPNSIDRLEEAAKTQNQPVWTKVGTIPEEVVAHCRRSVSVNDFTRILQDLDTGDYEIFVLTKYVKEI